MKLKFNEKAILVFIIGVVMAISVTVMASGIPFTKPSEPTYDVLMEIPIQYSLISIEGVKTWQIGEIQDIQITKSSFGSKFTTIPRTLFWGIYTGEIVIEGKMGGKSGKVDLGKFSIVGDTKLAVLEVKGVEPGKHKLYIDLKENGVLRKSKVFEVEV
ncbi:MAG: hypothetical protein V3U02_06600 [Calditrichia bacterium]